MFDIDLQCDNAIVHFDKTDTILGGIRDLYYHESGISFILVNQPAARSPDLATSVTCPFVMSYRHYSGITMGNLKISKMSFMLLIMLGGDSMIGNWNLPFAIYKPSLKRSLNVKGGVNASYAILKSMPPGESMVFIFFVNKRNKPARMLLILLRRFSEYNNCFRFIYIEINTPVLLLVQLCRILRVDILSMTVHT